MSDNIAVIRLRGKASIERGVDETLNMLHLYARNYCAVCQKSPSIMGMIHKVKDYVTFGEIDPETFKFLIEKRGERWAGREADRKGKMSYTSRWRGKDERKIKPFFRLNNPLGGFERKGLKVSYQNGGSLGNRGKEINSLIRRMVHDEIQA
ncbi:MAG TPA: uL30 family ribosomal protein [Candidatus Nanoarchaeia archaeon]|nr:uL30 family ribosomal protein [Candidatus Nanoarchaeia archaeon]